MNVLTRTRRGRWGLAVPAVLAAAGLPLALTAEPARDPEAPAAEAPATAAGPREWIGNGGCSGRGCHGAVAPEGTRGSEYNTWKVFDRHSRAYTVLLNERSRTIEKNLHGLDKLEDAPPAEKDALCLKCHDQPGRPPGTDLLATTGVGCETCHGPAVQWLHEHYQPVWKDPQKVSREQKQAKGMVLMDTAAARAAVCVKCHVGDADREVNHDLIAAGHPRLNFELDAFMADMPKHWDVAAVDARPGHGSTSEAETWAVGQVATARAALELLADRAGDDKAPWPEFTEYGCFACHHDLRDRGVRFWREGLDLRPGALPWGTWAFMLLDTLADRPDGVAGLTKGVDDLARAMGAPYPDRQEVAQQAGQLAQSLGGWLQQMQDQRFTTQQLQMVAGALRDDSPALARKTRHWDAAAQLYLMLAALDQDLGDDPARRQALEDLRLLLSFPTSPDGTGQDSPSPNFDPDQILDAVDKVLQAVPAP